MKKIMIEGFTVSGVYLVSVAHRACSVISRISRIRLIGPILPACNKSEEAGSSRELIPTGLRRLFLSAVAKSVEV